MLIRRSYKPKSALVEAQLRSAPRKPEPSELIIVALEESAVSLAASYTAAYADTVPLQLYRERSKIGRRQRASNSSGRIRPLDSFLERNYQARVGVCSLYMPRIQSEYGPGRKLLNVSITTGAHCNSGHIMVFCGKGRRGRSPGCSDSDQR